MDGLIARAYIRVSTDEQAVSGYSLPAQRERLESFAKSQGWLLARIYEDDGYSAKDTHRPALQEMLAGALPGEVILVYKLDRLTRSVIDLYELLRVFEQKQLLFKSATEDFNTTTSQGRMMIALTALFAQWERETIAERVKMGRQKKAASGDWPGGPIPFGYTAEPSGKVKAGKMLLKLVPDPERAHLVRQMFERYLAGVGMRGLAIWLNDELAVRTAQGGRWRVESVRRLLTNPVYCGYIVHGRRTGGLETVTKGNHEPLIDPERFERVQRLFALHKELPPRQATGNYPLTGAAHCGVCGAGVGVHVTKRGYYYKCLNWSKGLGCGDRPFTSMPGHVAEALVVQVIAGLGAPAALATYYQECAVQWEERSGLGAAEVRRLASDLAEAQQAIKRWDLAYEAGRLDLSGYLARVQPHQERIRRMQEQLARVNQLPAPPETAACPAGAFDFRYVWEHADPRERKTLIQRFVRGFGAKLLLGPDRHVQVLPELGG